MRDWLPDCMTRGFGVKYLECMRYGLNILRVVLDGQGGEVGLSVTESSSRSIMELPHPQYVQLLTLVAGCMSHLALRIR